MDILQNLLRLLFHIKCWFDLNPPSGGFFSLQMFMVFKGGSFDFKSGYNRDLVSKLLFWFETLQ